MCIKPEPRVFKCSACGWRKRIAPRSDAIVLSNDDMKAYLHRLCPVCNSQLSSERSSTMFESLRKIFNFHD